MNGFKELSKNLLNMSDTMGDHFYQASRAIEYLDSQLEKANSRIDNLLKFTNQATDYLECKDEDCFAAPLMELALEKDKR